MLSFRKSLMCATAAAIAFASATSAQGVTYVVDDNGGPGVNFTDLPAATAAASDGDVLIVRAGNYSAFQLTKGLTILGENGARVRAGSLVLGLPTGLHAVLSRLSLADLVVKDCVGAVIVDNATIDETHFQSAVTSQVDINNCDDVRFHRTTIEAKGQLIGVPAGPKGVTITDSRVEFASCIVKGARGLNYSSGSAGKGGIGMECQSGARVHIALTSVFGGDGGTSCPNSFGCFGGNGNWALVIQGGADVLVAGVVGNEIRGGARGDGWLPGYPGQAAYLLTGASLRWSGAEFFVGAGGGAPIAYWPNSTLLHVTPDDPTVELAGDPTPGASIAVVLHGAFGTNARLQQGHQPLVIADGQAYVERLTNRLRMRYLGPYTWHNRLTVPLRVPTTWLPGMLQFVQGMEIDPQNSALIERANSVPIVVH